VDFAAAAAARNPAHRGEYHPSDLYRARKRAVTLLCHVAENPPPRLSRPNQLRYQTNATVALTRLASGVGANMLVQLGVVMTAVRVMKKEANNVRVVTQCMDLIRELLVNPLSMIAAVKSKGFQLMPQAICHIVEKYHADDVDACGAAAGTLWPAATVGKRPAQDAIVKAGAVDFIARALSRPKRDDPSGTNAKKFIGCLLALAIHNRRVQEMMIKGRVRSLIRKGLVEHAHISFKGEFSALREWTKDEFTNPTPLPNGVTIDASSTPSKSKAASPPGSPSKRERGGSKTPTSAARTPQQQQQQQQRQPPPNSMLKSPPLRSPSGRRVSPPNGSVAERLSLTPDQMYAARKQAVTMLAAVAVNPPGKKSGVSPRESEETAYRCLLGLA
jgi:hypothetical protein